MDTKLYADRYVVSNPELGTLPSKILYLDLHPMLDTTVDAELHTPAAPIRSPDLHTTMDTGLDAGMDTTLHT